MSLCVSRFLLYGMNLCVIVAAYSLRCLHIIACAVLYVFMCSAGQVFGDSLLFIIDSWCSHVYHSVGSLGNRSEFIGIVVEHTMCFFISVL